MTEGKKETRKGRENHKEGGRRRGSTLIIPISAWQYVFLKSSNFINKGSIGWLDINDFAW